MAGAYGGTEFDTPNLDAFARRAVRFRRHYSGSLPCMPARHDVLCGALDFLWKPWGSIEIWERPITADVRRSQLRGPPHALAPEGRSESFPAEGGATRRASLRWW
jgi:arylsulfatase A-like enzyme